MKNLFDNLNELTMKLYIEYSHWAALFIVFLCLLYTFG